MGEYNSVTCRNPACRYHAMLQNGPGWASFSYLQDLKQAYLADCQKDPRIYRSLQEGYSFSCTAAYLCPTCREFVNHNAVFIPESSISSGKPSVQIYFPFEMPLCQKCGTALQFISNVRSSYVKCPKCGGDLKARIAGYYD